MKIYIFIFIIISNLNAYILFLGDSNDKFKCDNKEYSPTELLKCREIIAVTDIIFCYFKDANLGCKKLFSDEHFVMKNIDNNSLSFKRLLSFNEVQQTSFGIKRFADVKNENNSVPIGTILKPKNDLNIYIQSKERDNVFWLLKNKKIIFQTKVKNKKITIPQELFNYGMEYSWIIKNKKQRFSGDFDILDKKSEKELYIELAKNIKDISNKKVIKQIKSIIFDEYGLKYNRFNLLKGKKIEKDIN